MTLNMSFFLQRNCSHICTDSFQPGALLRASPLILSWTASSGVAHAGSRLLVRECLHWVSTARLLPLHSLMSADLLGHLELTVQLEPVTSGQQSRLDNCFGPPGAKERKMLFLSTAENSCLGPQGGVTGACGPTRSLRDCLRKRDAGPQII